MRPREISLQRRVPGPGILQTPAINMQDAMYSFAGRLVYRLRSGVEAESANPSDSILQLGGILEVASAWGYCRWKKSACAVECGYTYTTSPYLPSQITSYIVCQKDIRSLGFQLRIFSECRPHTSWSRYCHWHSLSMPVRSMYKSFKLDSNGILTVLARVASGVVGLRVQVLLYAALDASTI